jgi:glutathione S-transferase
MMLTIYGMYRSRATRNIWLLTELGQAFVHKPVMQAYRLPDPHASDAPFNTLSPEFLRVSPAGAIPVMEDDGFILSESIAINFHIANRFGGPVAPSGPSEHSRMLQWAFYGVSVVEETALSIQMTHTGGKSATREGMAKLSEAKQKLRRPFAALNGALGDQGYLVGGRFTVADINMAEMVRYAQMEPAFLAEFPALDAWLKACQARPAFQDMWAKRAAEPA